MNERGERHSFASCRARLVQQLALDSIQLKYSNLLTTAISSRAPGVLCFWNCHQLVCCSTVSGWTMPCMAADAQIVLRRYGLNKR